MCHGCTVVAEDLLSSSCASATLIKCMSRHSVQVVALVLPDAAAAMSQAPVHG
jgi:hypothetical protein